MSKKEVQAPARFGELFAEWKFEHSELNSQVEALADWLRDIAPPTAADLKSITHRLRQFLLRLQSHFDKEHRVGNLLAESRGTATIEIDAVRRRADSEHAALSARLEKLISEIETGQFDNWQMIADAFSLFVDALEQHEEQEEESIAWLSPTHQT